MTWRSGRGSGDHGEWQIRDVGKGMRRKQLQNRRASVQWPSGQCVILISTQPCHQHPHTSLPCIMTYTVILPVDCHDHERRPHTDLYCRLLPWSPVLIRPPSACIDSWQSATPCKSPLHILSALLPPRQHIKARGVFYCQDSRHDHSCTSTSRCTAAVTATRPPA